MEVKVTVTHELGEETKKFIASLLGGVAAAPATKAPAAKPAAASKENTDEEAEEEKPATRAKRGAAKPATKAKDEEVEEAEEDEAPKGRARRSTASKAKEEDEAPATKTRSRKPATKAEDEAPVFADMSDEEKLDEIKAKITLTTKKKGGADDVRELLGVFDAGRAGELNAKDYDEFYDALTRYRAGESVDEIFPEVD